MKIEEKKSSGLTKDFSVTVPAKMIAEKMAVWFAQKAKHVRLDGFRPGKVPLAIIEQRYSAHAQGDTLEAIIQDATQKIVKDHEIRVVGHPVYDNIDKYVAGKDFTFSITLESFPEIKLQDFKNLKVDKLVVEISEKEVDETLQLLAEGRRKFSPAADTHKAKEGDRVKMDITCEIDQKKNDGLSAKGIEGIIGENSTGLDFIDDKLKGQKKGAVLKIDHAFEADHHNKKIAGKTAKFEVAITEVSEPQDIKIDEDFAKDCGMKDLDALRAAIKESIQSDKNNLAKVYHKRHILDAMAEIYTFDLPKSMVKKEFDLIWNRLQAEIEQARADGTFEDDDDRPEAEIRKEYEDISSRRVRLGLVISEISKAHGIRVTPEMARNAVYREAMGYQGQEKEVVKFYRDHPHMIENLTSPILEDLVVDFILSKATVKEVKVTTKQLSEKMKGVLPGYGDDEGEEKKPSKASKAPKSEEKATKPKKKSEGKAA